MDKQPKTNFSSTPIDLQRTNQWLNFGLNPNNPKQPSSPTNGFDGWQNHLTNFETAKTYAELHGLGVGFAFCNQTEFFGIDLDGCIDPANGAIEPWAQTIVDLVDGYTEVSMSMTGLKIIARGHTTEKLQKLDYGDARHGVHRQQCEFKTVSGYFALTGILHPQLRRAEV